MYNIFHIMCFVSLYLALFPRIQNNLVLPYMFLQHYLRIKYIYRVINFSKTTKLMKNLIRKPWDYLIIWKIYMYSSYFWTLTCSFKRICVYFISSFEQSYIFWSSSSFLKYILKPLKIEQCQKIKSHRMHKILDLQKPASQLQKFSWVFYESTEKVSLQSNLMVNFFAMEQVAKTASWLYSRKIN